MTRRTIKMALLPLLFGAAALAQALHGPLSSGERDAWIDRSVSDLAAKTGLPLPEKPVAAMTNLEVARWTADAAGTLLAQAGGKAPRALSPRASGELERLVREFREELSGMQVDLDALDERLRRQERRAARYQALQEDYLSRTGAILHGYSRGYAHTFRGFGSPGTLDGVPAPGPVYGPMDYSSAMFVELDLMSIPAPHVVFDTKLRYWRSIGMYYADPLGDRINLDLRWISLGWRRPGAGLTAGDFYESYTPLTLWNAESPVRPLLEPAPLERERKDLEEIVLMDHGPDWHLRGFQATVSKQDLGLPVIGGAGIRAMGGALNGPSDLRFGGYYAGGRLTSDYLGGKAGLSAQGLRLWDDPTSAKMPYVPDFPSSWAREYRVGSLSGGVTLPLRTGMTVQGSAEYAGSEYREDRQDPERTFRDWAFLAEGVFRASKVRVSAKALRVDPHFYSPGAQTRRFSAANQDGYLGTGVNKDEALIGYRDRYPLKGVDRPSFAAYDRLRGNGLPYGDATPNRSGLLLGLSADLGRKGWLVPTASLTAHLKELEPNRVLSPDGSDAVAVESGLNTTAARSFGGFEAALVADLARLADLDESTYRAGLDYRRETTDLGAGLDPFNVGTFAAMLDFNPPISGFDGLLGSVAFERCASSGSEYVLTGGGSPPTLARYPYFLDTDSLGSYAYLPLSVTRTSWVFGLDYPLSATVHFYGSFLIARTAWSQVPGYDRRDKVWRVTYEASF